MIYLIGIDIGTTNIKVLLLEAKSGKTVAIENKTYEIEIPEKGYAEYNPEKWYEDCCECLKRILKNTKVNPKDIKAIGLSGQMHGLISLDEAGKPVYPAILHCDTRSERQIIVIKEKIDDSIIREELNNSLYTGFLLPSLCWVYDERPQLYERIRYVMLPKDYINYRLTGNICTDYSDASATLAFDIKSGCWSKNVLNRLNISEGLFPEIKNSYDVVGTITERSAAETGLDMGTAVICGGGDAVMQSLGNGLIDSKYAIINIGTSGQVLFSSSKLIENPELNTNIFCGYQKDNWISMGAIMSAGACYKWVTNLISESDYKAFDEKIAQVPIGSNGLIFLPHLNGERTPYLDPTLRGALIGISLESGKKEIGRAVMEGVSFALMLCYEVCLGLGLDTETFIISGGGSKSTMWTQMFSDIFNKPVKVSEMTEQAAVGAAMCAGVGVGVYSDIQDAVDHIVNISEKTYYPSSIAHEEYMKYYELFKNVYISNKNILREIYNQWYYDARKNREIML